MATDQTHRASMSWSPLKAAKQFMRRLIPEVINLQSSYGGPIIAVQVENEYGMYYNSDQNHLRRVFINSYHMTIWYGPYDISYRQYHIRSLPERHTLWAIHELKVMTMKFGARNRTFIFWVQWLNFSLAEDRLLSNRRLRFSFLYLCQKFTVTYLSPRKYCIHKNETYIFLKSVLSNPISVWLHFVTIFLILAFNAFFAGYNGRLWTVFGPF